jgi:hypothetical protein
MAAAIGGRANWVTSGSTASPGTYGSGAKIWFYASSNSADEMVALNTIGDGAALGMTLGDILVGVVTTAGSTAAKFYIGALVTSGGATGFSLSAQYLCSSDKTSG